MQNDKRLIDANAVSKTLRNLPFGYTKSFAGQVALKEIESAPTIDAVPVVRCWKCEHYTPTICHRLNTVVTPFDFCSYGKPKMDAKEE